MNGRLALDRQPSSRPVIDPQGIRRNCPFLVVTTAIPGSGDPIDRPASEARYAEPETAEPRPLDLAEGEELDSVANELPARSGAIRRFAVAAATAASGAVLIAGCAAGQDTQTTNQRPPIDGASADAGDISIRTAAVAASDLGSSYAKGSDAQLRLVIINNGPAQVELQSVSSPMAASAQVSSTGASQTESSSLSSSASPSSTASGTSAAASSPAGSGSATATASASRTASGTGTASASGSASASASASASETLSPTESASSPANTPISIPAGGSVQVGFSTSGPSVTLSGLTAELYPAQTVPVTFTFSDGTTVTLGIPVALPSSPASAPVVSDATEPAEPNN